MVDVVDRETARRARVVENAAALALVEAELSDRALWGAVLDVPHRALWAVEKIADPGNWSAGLAQARADGRLDSLTELAVRRGPGWRVVLALIAPGRDRDDREREQAKARKARFVARVEARETRNARRRAEYHRAKAAALASSTNTPEAGAA